MLHTHAPWWMVHLGIGQVIFYAVPFVLVGKHLTSTLNPARSERIWGISVSTLRRAYLGLLTFTLCAALLLVGRVVVRTIEVPPGWDFQALWLYGRVADSGQNPYFPGPYHELAGPGPFVEDFREEVLDVGAMYPPPTLLLFASIGWLPLRVAVVPWMILQTAAFVGMVVLLRRTFLPEPGVENLALTLTLALLLPSTLATFGHGQVNFLAVLCVVAAWRTRQKTVSGVYLVGAAILKLLYGALWLYPVLRRRSPPFKGIVAAGTGAVLASIAAFGWPVFSTYLHDNPGVHRMPSYYFGTFVNQSLLGASLRLFPYHMPLFGPPTHNPLYLASALIVGLISVWTVVRQPESEQGEEAAFTLLILMGMLIYPWTISNYYVLLLVPMGFLWARRSDRPVGLIWTIVLFSAVYPITYFRNGLYSIVATLLLWGTITVIAVDGIRKAARGQSEVAPAAHALPS